MDSEEKKSHFKLKNKVNLSEVDENTVLPESDLCFQNGDLLLQFEYVNEDRDFTVDVKPGSWTLSSSRKQYKPEKLEMRRSELLKDVTSSKAIYDEANIFFNNLDVYEELGELKSRKILLYSDPGLGKTSNIREFCQDAMAEDDGTVVFVWPTSSVDSDDVLNFLSKYADYSDDCSRVILVMEDIGGGEREGGHGSRAVDSALLDILDGIGVTFKLPTLIIATTNYPQNLLSALADRPGRFDKVMKLDAPGAEERVKITEFIAKRDLTADEKETITNRKLDGYSIAHLKELVIRSRLHQQSLADTVRELNKQRDMFKKAFEEKEEVGFGR
jgi:AAA+ superfamily predicted ATPase